jgi:hypothetical protein
VTPDIIKVPQHVAIMRIVVSLLVLITGLLIITSPNFAFSTKFDERINSFFILSGYYFSTQSSVYLLTVQRRFLSLHLPKGTFTDER